VIVNENSIDFTKSHVEYNHLAHAWTLYMSFNDTDIPELDIILNPHDTDNLYPTDLL
jgi:hypothetical protein